MGKHPNLAITVVAVLFLVLDGLLLGWVGVASGSAKFIAWSFVFFSCAAAVLVAYKNYRKNLTELEEARRVLREEIESMRRAVAQAGAGVEVGTDAGQES